MTENCKFFVNAGDGWCRTKKQLGRVSLLCQEMNQNDLDCESRHTLLLENLNARRRTEF